RTSAQGYLQENRQVKSHDTEQDFALKPMPLIEGRVVRGDNEKPVARFDLEIRRTPEDRTKESHWYGYSDTIENEEGKFSVQARSIGDLTVWVRAPGFDVKREYLYGVKPGESRSDVVVRLGKSSVIRGLVTALEGEPIKEAQIFFGYPPALLSMGFSVGGLKTARAHTNADGSFQVTGLVPNLELISAYHPDYTPGWTQIQPDYGGESEVRIELTKGGMLTGVITLDGRPVSTEECDVVARFPDGKGQVTAKTDSSGVYSVSNLTPVLTKVHYYPRLSLKDVWSCHHLIEAEAEIADGETTSVDVDFVSGYDATIEGTVYYDGVQVKSSEAQIWLTSVQENGTRAEFQTSPDENGHYRFESIPSGVLEGRITGYAPDGPYLEREFTVESRSGEVIDLDLELTR
ncbi:hypothetical protein ACFL1X_03170, partial [Candidatus Hydrogenedentota bacterium]